MESTVEIMCIFHWSPHNILMGYEKSCKKWCGPKPFDILIKSLESSVEITCIFHWLTHSISMACNESCEKWCGPKPFDILMDKLHPFLALQFGWSMVLTLVF